ncbi:MAG: T9SS type A sorting domain-containing protein, partial [candidate division WOR-3 bacterium]
TPGGSAPTIDGFMAPGEWSDAYAANISNGLGRGMSGNNPFGPNAAWIYFKNDASYLYIACAMPEWANRAIGDQFGIYLDENNNGAWEAAPVEGNYWIWVNGSSADEVLYRPWTAPYNAGTPGGAPGSLSASTWYNGYLVFECRLPLGTLPYQLDFNPTNDTLGMFLYAQGNNRLYGWWPIDLDADTAWYMPMFYGKLIALTQQQGNIKMAQIVRPSSGSVQVGTTLIPAGKWENTGTTEMNFTAYFFLDSAGTRVYSESQTATLAGGASVTLEFASYTFGPDESEGWVAKCSTAAAGDQIAGDNVLTREFNVTTAPPWPEGWVEVANLPGPAKDGGWLTGNAGDGLIYGGRGYKALDFYSYDPDANTWTTLPAIPAGAKPPHKGSNGVADGANSIYFHKGNKTFEFYVYDIPTATWTQLADVPGGTSGKPGKNSDLAYYDGYVYLLKGNKSDFARFDVATGAWEALPDAPAGSKAKWDKGSWIVSDGAGIIYAHKGKYHEMFPFDVATQTWGTALSGMPFMGQLGKNKKSKDGGSAAFYDGAIYALKGGNTVEFWKYVTGTATWTELALMPEIGSTGKKKRVKAGGDLAGWSGGPVFFALKGNKTTEFWRYVEPAAPMSQPERGGVAAQPVALKGYGFALSPNPVRGLATLSYSVPTAGAARVTVLDVTGRDVVTRTLTANRTGTTSLDLTGLSAGVYLVKLESPNYTAAAKLIVQ